MILSQNLVISKILKGAEKVKKSTKIINFETNYYGNQKVITSKNPPLERIIRSRNVRGGGSATCT